MDESALGLGKALTAARSDTVHVGHPLVPECPYGTLDPDWMPAVAARGLIAIGRDRRMRTRPAEVLLSGSRACVSSESAASGMKRRGVG
ncbi:PIN-like domain-containing protein [Blastococcus tunisiensis]|uniref:PIN-like domain-containing protein n=1 Tax=Blastococcus tunisiensis TaxID=1798228 RepID=UPI003AA87DF1